MIETTELDCGMVVVTERMADVHSVSCGFWVGTGSRDEGDHLAGASHFLEHLLFKGTPSRTARQIAEDVDAVGGDMNAYTTKEYTAFYIRVLDQRVELALDLLSDILWSPAFRAEEVEAERQVILEEILMRADEPSDLVHDVFGEAMFPDHPLGRDVLGDQSSITAMSREEIAGFHAHHYRPGNVVFAAAGQLHHAAIVEGVERRLAVRPGGQSPSRTAPGIPAKHLAVDRRRTEQVHLVLGTRAVDRHDEDRYALSVVNQALGGGASSRLFQSIRERRGLCYSVYSYPIGYHDTGVLCVYTGTMASHVDEVLKLMVEEMDRIAEEGISARELEVAKGHLVGEMALSLEDSAARMSRIGRSQLLHGEVLSVEELSRRIEAVTLEDAARVGRAVLGNDRVLAVVGAMDEAALSSLGA